MFGLVTRKTYEQAIAAQKRAFAAALALASGNMTIDDLRKNAANRKEMVEGVKRGLEEQIAETMALLADLNAQRDHAKMVADDLGAILDVLPAGVTVSLDPLVIELGQPTLETDEAASTE